MSGNPSPPSNVVPWPQPPWPSSAVPPGCFSELARLNQCYNEVQMMEMILSKVVCDLATNNAAFQQCLVNAIAKSGSNVPLIGVTNGADAQPGQVGEYVQFVSTLPIPIGATNQAPLQSGVLQPGDWDVYAWMQTNGSGTDVAFYLNPIPAGFANQASGSDWGSTTGSGGGIIIGSMCRALISVPTLMVFAVDFTSAITQTATLTVEARRRR